MNKSELWIVWTNKDNNTYIYKVNEYNAMGTIFVSGISYIGDFKTCVSKMRELAPGAKYNGGKS